MSHFKTMGVTEIRLGVSTSFGSVLTKIMLLLQLTKVGKSLRKWIFLFKEVTSSMLVDLLIL